MKDLFSQKTRGLSKSTLIYLQESIFGRLEKTIVMELGMELDIALMFMKAHMEKNSKLVILGLMSLDSIRMVNLESELKIS